jgi:hypothetical protein
MPLRLTILPCVDGGYARTYSIHVDVDAVFGKELDYEYECRFEQCCVPLLYAWVSALLIFLEYLWKQFERQLLAILTFQ